MATPVVRVSVLRCDPSQFDRFREMMRLAETTLRPGIEAMPGLLAYYAGDDPATSSLTNTSIWSTLDDARQMESFEPMLELGRRFAEEGARFDRPIMNYQVLWSFGPDAVRG
jgi:hypothetical protein